MKFRQKNVKHLAILGIILVILNVLLPSHYGMCQSGLGTDLTKTMYNNLTIAKVKNVLGFQRMIVHTINSIMTTRQEDREGQNGFEGAAVTHNICTLQDIRSTGAMTAIHVILGHRFLYCPVAKIGTTFWRRVFYMLELNNHTKYKQPYDVPTGTAHGQMKRFTYPITSSVSGNLLTRISFSFLFVRNPYSRLLSAFIDKLVSPNPTYWKVLGVPAISQFRPKQKSQHTHVIDGHDVTFEEFVKYVVNAERSGRNSDDHIISINRRCKPCTHHYIYVGRVESFKDDALFIMRILGMKTTVDSIEKCFTDYMIDDTITDSIKSPFFGKADIVKYISWEQALHRIWLKIQMRGIIESSITLDITKDDVDTINVNQFIEMARKAHRKSNPIELEKQKELPKIEAFASIPLSVLMAFRDTFNLDFTLFGYDPSPSYIFNRGEEPHFPTHLFNYSYLN